MNVHYINILLFAVPLNVLVILSHLNTHKRTYITHHIKNTKQTKPHRSLCECDLYMANYDNDTEMKKLMENFTKQTQQRFHEYDEHNNEKLQKCKEQCEKDIRKIILKDKIEKELTEKLSSLQTDISINDIPTCICEKSLADKMGKNCLKCVGIIGTAIPQLALLGGVSTYMLTTAATSAATKAGMREVVSHIKEFLSYFKNYLVDLTPIVNESNYNCGTALFEAANKAVSTSCLTTKPGIISPLCSAISNGKATFNNYAQYGINAYNEKFKAEMVGITSFNNAMMASIIAIVVIVLIMVIIYFILRYRRKKKMTKKLQYIKLLNE
ncbi:hypothetical protein PFFCH_01775 [Plasmodium falciparum FCH/4]|uniref:Surface antigen n=1 Tax=Plasmodium falciparum FCH/4 TaxID=1036724 RepID=A0A024VPY1_PLAFA|nr:hypothetical protein PFFCH_01775 [Plasmodium falciparum FCH/4]